MRVKSKYWESLEQLEEYKDLFFLMEIKKGAKKRKRKDFPKEITNPQWSSLCSICSNLKKGEKITLKKKQKKKKKQSAKSKYHLRRINYKSYLKSSHWKQLREVALFRDKVCKKCGSSIYLQVHHKSYKNRGDFWKEIDDLIVLCRNCHKAEHNIK